MSDITKCKGIKCPLKHRCERFLAPVSERQDWHDFTPDLTEEEGRIDCPHYLEHFVGVMLY